MKGKVILVGAGPGDPGLLTLSGHAALKRADVVVTDALVNPQLLEGLSARVIDVGKRGPGAPQGAHQRESQSSINRILVKLAQRGEYVVRLKGGDPFVFGRGSEELEALLARRIPYEVIPGVSSAYAVPAYAGIPITDRRYASHVTFLTGHEKGENGADWSINWDKLSSEGTLVILMGVSRWPFIQNELLKRGWPSAHPVAAIEWGTTPRQRVIHSRLDRAQIDFAKDKLHSPAIVVVGRVAKLGRSLNWFQKSRPLLGMRVAITRPKDQSSELVEKFRAAGAVVIAAPTIQLKSLASTVEVRRHLKKIRMDGRRFDHLIFLSANAVRFFHGVSHSLHSQLQRAKISVVGEQTARVARDLGWKVNVVPSSFNGAALIRQMGRLTGKRCLIPRVQGTPKDIVTALQKRGALVEVIEIYRNERAPLSEDVKRQLKSGVDALVFTSSSTAKRFMENFGARERRLFVNIPAISMGAQTSAELRRNGFRRIEQARTATLDDVLVKAAQIKRRLKQ